MSRLPHSLQVFLQMFLVESAVVDGCFVCTIVEETCEDVSEVQVPLEAIVLPKIKQCLGHHLIDPHVCTHRDGEEEIVHDALEIFLIAN